MLKTEDLLEAFKSDHAEIHAWIELFYHLGTSPLTMQAVLIGDWHEIHAEQDIEMKIVKWLKNYSSCRIKSQFTFAQEIENSIINAILFAGILFYGQSKEYELKFWKRVRYIVENSVDDKGSPILKRLHTALDKVPL